MDIKKKIHFYYEDGFARLFYDFLLRLDFEEIDEVIYDVIETFILFINSKLKILIINNNKFELLQQNILGNDYIFDIVVNSDNEKVKEKGEKFLIKIF